MPRRSTIVYADELPELAEQEPPDTDPVNVFLSKEGYFKKITPQSLRMSSEQKYKEGDSLKRSFETSNDRELLFFTDRQQVYRLRLADVEQTKASVLGSYLPTLLKMDEGESVIDMVEPGDYRGSVVLAFANGKLAHIPMEAWQTKTYRKKLLNAYSDKSPLIGLEQLQEPTDLVLYTNDDRCLVVNSSMLNLKPTRSTQGVAVVTLHGKKQLMSMRLIADAGLRDPSRYRARALPRAPISIKPEDLGEEQLSLL